MQANMEAGARRLNMGILFTNPKLLSVHFESAPRSESHTATPKKDLGYINRKGGGGSGTLQHHYVRKAKVNYGDPVRHSKVTGICYFV